MNAYLRPSELAAFLGLKDRATRKVLGELEALGFKLEPAPGGVRLCAPQLAEAVKTARTAGQELAVLRLDPSLIPFLAQNGAGRELDPLDVLIFTATELAICREVIGTMANALTSSGFRPFSFKNASLPDPRLNL